MENKENENLYKSIVKITSNMIYINPFDPENVLQDSESTGTGFFLDNKHILTCAHVVEQSSKIWISNPMIGRKLYSAHVKSICKKKDLAIIKLNDDYKFDKIDILKIGDSNKIKRRDITYVLGYPLGQKNLKITTGIISGIQNYYIQTDAPINSGNSGGPLIDKNGNVIGINTAKISTAENIGYARPINDFLIIRNELLQENNEEKNEDKKKNNIIFVDEPNLYCEFQNSNDITDFFGYENNKGYIIKYIHECSPLYNILNIYDIIYKINDYEFDNYGECTVDWSSEKIHMSDIICRFSINDKINVTYGRYNAQTKITITDMCEIILKKKKEIKIFKIYYPFEKFKYYTFNGITYEELNNNYISEARNNIDISNVYYNRLIKYLKTENKCESKIVIAKISYESYAHESNILKIGMIINRINYKNKISTIEDVILALNNPYNKNTLLIAEDNVIIYIKNENNDDNKTEKEKMIKIKNCINECNK